MRGAASTRTWPDANFNFPRIKQLIQKLEAGKFDAFFMRVAVKPARRAFARYSLSQYEAVYAYGDTPDDNPLLALATHKYYRWQDVS